jgi:hypothetical protein
LGESKNCKSVLSGKSGNPLLHLLSHTIGIKEKTMDLAGKNGKKKQQQEKNNSVRELFIVTVERNRSSF